MAAFTTSALTLFCILFATETNAMKKEESLPRIPTPPSLRKAPAAPIARDLQALRKNKTTRVKGYAFGATAAQTLEEAIDLGFFKNEHPYKALSPFIENLQVGHCVIVPRSDQSFSYGVVTEVLNPNMVEVACGPDKHNQNGYTIKIIASNQLYLRPEWLNLTQKDGSTLAHYNHAMKQLAPLPENLIEEESYEQLPAKIVTKMTKK